MPDGDTFTITKKISKMGDNNILVIPKDLKGNINSGDLVEVNIRIVSSQTEEKAQGKNDVQSQKRPEKTISTIIDRLMEKGYSTPNIRKVLVEYGYNGNEVDKVLKNFSKKK